MRSQLDSWWASRSMWWGVRVGSFSVVVQWMQSFTWRRFHQLICFKVDCYCVRSCWRETDTHFLFTAEATRRYLCALPYSQRCNWHQGGGGCGGRVPVASLRETTTHDASTIVYASGFELQYWNLARSPHISDSCMTCTTTQDFIWFTTKKQRQKLVLQRLAANDCNQN